MKYLNMTSNGNMLYYTHLHDSGGRIKRELKNELIPKDDLLDGKVHVPPVLKCLGLTVGILPFEHFHESRLSNLTMPSLHIYIDGLGLFNAIYVNFQTVLLDKLQK